MPAPRILFVFVAGTIDGPLRLARPAHSLSCASTITCLFSVRSRLFESQGWHVETAESGRSAMSKVTSRRFDVLLVDLRLPDLTGLELVRRFRQSGVRVPGVILTAFPEQASAKEATDLELGYLSKADTHGFDLIDAVRSCVRPGPVRSGPTSRVEQQLERASRALQVPLLGAADRAQHWSVFARLILGHPTSIVELVTAAEALRILSDYSTEPFVAARFLRRLAEQLDERQSSAQRLGLDELPSVAFKSERFQQESTSSDQDRLDARIRRHLGWKLRRLRLASIMRMAAIELAFTNEQVAQIAYRLNYDHHSVFDREFREVFGVSPRAFRQRVRSDSDGSRPAK